MKNKIDYYDEVKRHFCGDVKDDEVPKGNPFRLVEGFRAVKFSNNGTEKPDVCNENYYKKVRKWYNKEAGKLAKKYGRGYVLKMLETPNIYNSLNIDCNALDCHDKEEDGNFLYRELDNIGFAKFHTNSFNTTACPEKTKVSEILELNMDVEISFMSEMLSIDYFYLCFANFKYCGCRSVNKDFYSDMENYQKLYNCFVTEPENKLALPVISASVLKKIPAEIKQALYDVKMDLDKKSSDDPKLNEARKRAVAIWGIAEYLIDIPAIQAAIGKAFLDNLPVDNSMEAWYDIPNRLNPVMNKIFKPLSKLYSKVLEIAYDVIEEIDYETLLTLFKDKEKRNELYDSTSKYFPELRKYYNEFGITHIKTYGDNMKDSGYYETVKGNFHPIYNYIYVRPGNYFFDNIFKKYTADCPRKR